MRLGSGRLFGKNEIGQQPSALPKSSPGNGHWRPANFVSLGSQLNHHLRGDAQTIQFLCFILLASALKALNPGNITYIFGKVPSLESLSRLVSLGDTRLLSGVA